MNMTKAPVVNLSATLHRALLMFIVIVFGILISYSSADAGVKIEKDSFNKSVQRKKNHTHSCEALMVKHRSSSNMVVKINHRRPKWR